MMMNANNRKNHNSGVSLLELIIVITIMAILVGVVTPMLFKYVEKAKKSKDVQTAALIAKAVTTAFADNPEAYDAYHKWTGAACTVTVMENGVQSEPYTVYRVAASGKQDTNPRSNCFNGGTREFKETPSGDPGRGDGSTGFYGVINRELGLSTTEMNGAIVPKFTKPREGAGVKRRNGAMEPYAELDRWRIVKRADDGTMEIWAAQPNPEGGYPIYRVWPTPDDIYK